MAVKLQILSIITSALILSGCNNDSSPATSTELPVSDLSRIAIQEAETNMVYIFNAETMDNIGQMALQNVPSSLKTSPNGRYVLAFQTEGNLIEVIDSGVISKNHGDHNDISTEAPRLLSVQYYGIQPTNYDMSDQEVSVFFDGNAESGEGAEFRVLNEASIGAGEVVAKHTFDYSMHGTSQILGDILFTGIVWDNEGAYFPDRVLWMERNGSHFHGQAVFPQTCPYLFGSAQLKAQVFFACADGMVVIEQNPDDQWDLVSHKLNYPTEFGENSWFQSLIGFNNANKLLAIADNYQMFFLQNNELVKLDWKKNSDDKILGYTTTEDKLIVVTSQGEMRVFDPSNNFELSDSITLWKSVPEFIQVTEDNLPVKLIKDKRNGHIFITDEINNLLLEVSDSSTPQVVAHPLSYKPGKIAWLGAEKPSVKQ